VRDATTSEIRPADILEIVRDGEVRQEIRLRRSPLRIGRSEGNEIVLQDPFKSVSPYHAELEYKDGKYVVKDLNSPNGVWVQGRRVPNATLQLGDACQIGIYTLRLKPPLTNGDYERGFEKGRSSSDTAALALEIEELLSTRSRSLASADVMSLNVSDSWPVNVFSLVTASNLIVATIIVCSVAALVIGVTRYSGTHFGAGLTFGGGVLLYEALYILVADREQAS
jgi:pSer/pThr/pTyr-binding forkhead associated (FHA) protein